MSSMTIQSSIPTTGSPNQNSESTVSQTISDLIPIFQKNQATPISETNCQRIEMNGVHYYGIHKKDQLQASNRTTRELYQKLKAHVLQNM